MAQYSALRCVSGIWQNSEKPLISNRLRFVVTCLLAAALWVLFHVARHSFAVMSINNGMSVYMLSKLLGHSSTVATEKTYAQFLKEKVKDDVKSILDFKM